MSSTSRRGRAVAKRPPYPLATRRPYTCIYEHQEHTRGWGMASLRKRGRNWYYAFIGADGRRVERKGCPDKRATEEMARAVETGAARSRAGLIDHKAERMADAERRPIGDHLT